VFLDKHLDVPNSELADMHDIPVTDIQPVHRKPNWVMLSRNPRFLNPVSVFPIVSENQDMFHKPQTHVTPRHSLKPIFNLSKPF
jgi:hypothetical protein